MSTDHSTQYSFIVMRPGACTPWQFRLSQPVIYCTLTFFLVFVFIVGFIGYRTLTSQHNYREYTMLKQQIELQHTAIKQSQNTIDQLTLDVERILAQEYDLTLLLGDIKKKRRSSKKKLKK